MKKLSMLNTNCVRSVLTDIPTEIYFADGLSALCFGNNKVRGVCVNCEEQYCMQYSEEEIVPDFFRSFPHNTDCRVCPTKSIVIENGHPIISESCIACGLCLSICRNSVVYQ